MEVFLIAIIVSIVLRYVSGFIIKLYVSLDKTDHDLNKSFIFNAAALIYIINTGLIFINGSVLAALIIKTYLL